METMKILMVSTFYPPYHIGGDAVHVKYLADELTAAGHEVHIIHSLDAYHLKKNKEDFIKNKEEEHVYRLQSNWGSFSAATSYLTGRNRNAERLVEKVSAEIKPDWIHYHNISLLGCGVLSQGNAPKIYTSHDHWPFCQRNDYMRFGEKICDDHSCLTCSIRSHRPMRMISTQDIISELKKIDAIIAPSEYMQRMLSRFGAESTVIKNFVPHPIEDISFHGEPHFIYTGVLEKHKGLDLLIRAYLKSNLDSEVHILGDGSLKQEVTKLTKEGVKYLGFLPRSKLIPEVASSLCMVAPSICGENSPLSCIESLSVGVPLIVSPNGGLPELATGCGLVSPPHEADLAAALMRLDKDEELRDKMSHNALTKYRTEYSPEAYLKQYFSLTEAVI